MPNRDLATLAAVAARSDVPEDARKVIAAAMTMPLGNDKWIYRIVVVVLGLTVLATVVGGVSIVLVSQGRADMTLPGAIVAIGSAAVGALAGLLAPSPAGARGGGRNGP